MSTVPEDNPNEVMSIIMNGGQARSAAMAAIKAAKARDFAAAATCMSNARVAVKNAQVAHNSLLSAEARGDGADFSVLLVHAENHLSNALTIIDMADQFVETYRELAALEKRVNDQQG